MNARDAIALVRAAAPAVGGTWADLGAGRGTFTRALAQLLGPRGHVYAVDCDRAALAELRARPSEPGAARIEIVEADFTGPFQLPGAAPGTLSGLLLANALHFTAGPARVLGHLCAWLRTGGQILLIEYDRRAASRWVPHPIWIESLPAPSAEAPISDWQVVARRPSAYGGDLYVAVARCIRDPS